MKSPDLWYRMRDAVGQLWRKLDRWIDAHIGGDGKRDDGVAHQFKSNSVAIEEARVPISAHAVLYVILLLMVIAIFWGIFGSLDRIVVAQGKVATRTPLIVMQPFTTSRITQIHVTPGDHVRKGDALVSFDPAFAQADQSALEQKVQARSAEIARLEAELAGAKSFTAQANDSPERHTQAQIFAQEMAQFSAEMAQRDNRVGAIDSELRSNALQVVGLRSQLEMAQRVTAMQNKLQAQNAASTLDVLRAQSNEVDVQTRLTSAEGDEQKYGQQRAETEAERSSYLDKWRSDHNQQLVQARQDVNEAVATLDKARRMKDFTRLIAPTDAVVLEIADRSVGSVLREAETLVTLVPDSAQLYVEASVPSRDIGYLKVGDKVRIKLEAYPFQRYGTLDGVLDVISADSVPLKEDDRSSLVYKVQVRITTPLKALAGRGIHLQPGLVATAEITTGKRSIASYVLNPILRTTDESLREP